MRNINHKYYLRYMRNMPNFVYLFVLTNYISSIYRVHNEYLCLNCNQPIVNFYSLYTTPLHSIVSKYPGLRCHFYADETQMYLSFSPELASSAFTFIETCIKDIFSWMIGNKLSVNPDKTEYLLFNSKNINVPVSINLNLNTISPSEYAQNLGVIFQSDMSMDKHISSAIKTCFHQLHEFRHIRSFIPKSAAIIFANAFIHSRIDYCNSLFLSSAKVLN